jgi:hypothetical protein
LAEANVHVGNVAVGIARASLIADGCNEVLAIKGGSLLTNPDLL